MLGTDAGVPVGDVTALTTDPDTGVLAVAARDPDQVLLYDLETLDAPGREPTTVVELPGPAEQLAVLQNTLVATVPSANVLARISLPDGELHTTSVPGRPTGVASFGDRLLVSLREGKGIGVVEDDHVVSTIKGGLNSADDVVVVDGRTIVLDRLRSAVFTVDVDGQDIGEGLRAGQGAANIVADAFGRVFTTDTRRSAVRRSPPTRCCCGSSTRCPVARTRSPTTHSVTCCGSRCPPGTRWSASMCGAASRWRSIATRPFASRIRLPSRSGRPES